MSKYVWSPKNENKSPIINWKIWKIVFSKTTLEYCKLCLMQKRYILNALVDERCHNKRREFISKCRHQNKLLFKNVKYSIDWFSVFYIILFYENFSFSFGTSRNVPQMNVQYKKLGVVYSTNIAFRKPIYHIEHFITCICDKNRNYSIYIYIYIYICSLLSLLSTLWFLGTSIVWPYIMCPSAWVATKPLWW